MTKWAGAAMNDQESPRRTTAKAFDDELVAARPRGLTIPNLRSPLGKKMGEAAKSPTVSLASPHAEKPNLKISRQSQEPTTPLGAKLPSSAISFPQSSASTKSLPNTFMRTRWLKATGAVAFLAITLLTGVLCGFVAGRGPDASIVAELNRARERMQTMQNEMDTRLSAVSSEAQAKEKASKDLSAQAEDDWHRRENDLIAQIEEAQKRAANFKHLAEEREIERQDARNELEKLTSFMSIAPEVAISWPSDPPKVVANSMAIDLKTGNAIRNTRGLKSRRIYSQGTAD